MGKPEFFRKMEELGLALSYDNIRVKTGHSEFLPTEVDLSSKFSRNVPLKRPIVSSPMDTVTEHHMAIAMAKLGGLGIIHRKLSLAEQIHCVERVKFHLLGFVEKPICVNENDTVEELLKRREEKEYSFHSSPVINNEGKLVGVLTADDFDFCLDLKVKVSSIMSTNLVTGAKDISFEKAFQKMREAKKKLLPLLDASNNIAGMYVWSDVRRTVTGNKEGYNLDASGRLRVGAAVGVGEEALERAEQLSRRGVDVIVIDTAHGDAKFVIWTLKEMKKLFSCDVVVGNISEPGSAKRLADAGADGIKVGQGPGSICTTRIIAGIGCPQVTAVYNCAEAIKGTGIPICADGGINYSGDITVALAIGADCVMIGNLFAGTDEAPGEVIMKKGRPYKFYRGMGSLSAMQESLASRERYGQAGQKPGKLVPEGIEGVVPYKGEVARIFEQLVGGLSSGMGYIGASSIRELSEKSDFYRIDAAGLRESHPHNVTITREAPNYAAQIEEEGL